MQRCLDHLIGEVVEVYIDDIMVKSRKPDHLVGNLEQTFVCQRSYGIKLNPEKCIFGVLMGKLLSFIVSERGIEANPEKITTIRNLGPIPNHRGTQKMMGCLPSLSQFISRLGERGMLLYKLLKKSDKFRWTDEAQESFDWLKAFLTELSTLISLDLEELLMLYITTTTQVVSAALVLERDEPGHDLKVQQPVYFVSEVLSNTKIRYPKCKSSSTRCSSRSASSCPPSRATMSWW
jgi:hypothetical protein